MQKIRIMMGIAIISLIAISIVAFPVVTNTLLLESFAGTNTPIGEIFPPLGAWISVAAEGVAATDKTYPFLFYMSDWMVAAHIMIAVFFWGAYRDPVRNIWIIEAGLIACGLVVLTALIAGDIRGIPFFWQLIDSSFGIICFIPLWLARKWTKEISAASDSH